MVSTSVHAGCAAMHATKVMQEANGLPKSPGRSESALCGTAGLLTSPPALQHGRLPFRQGFVGSSRFLGEPILPPLHSMSLKQVTSCIGSVAIVMSIRYRSYWPLACWQLRHILLMSRGPLCPCGTLPTYLLQPFMLSTELCCKNHKGNKGNWACPAFGTLVLPL